MIKNKASKRYGCVAVILAIVLTLFNGLCVYADGVSIADVAFKEHGTDAVYPNFFQYRDSVYCDLTVNNTGSPADICVVLAYYRDEELLRIKSSILNVPSGLGKVLTTEAISISDALPGNYRLDVLVYDNLNDMNPLSDTKYYQTKRIYSEMEQFIPDSGFEDTANGVTYYWKNYASAESSITYVTGSENVMYGDQAISYYYGADSNNGIELNNGGDKFGLLPKIKAMGAGTYRVSAMIKAEKSYVDCRLAARINGTLYSNNLANVISSGSYNYYYRDLELTDAVISGATSISFLIRTYTSCNSTGKKDTTIIPQLVYIDNFSVVKLTDDSEIVPNVIVKGKLNSTDAGKSVNLSVVKEGAESVEDDDVAFLGKAVVQNDGSYSCGFNFNKSLDEYIVRAKLDDRIVTKKLANAIYYNDRNVLEMNYMSQYPDGGAYVEALYIGQSPAPYGEVTLPAGNVPVTAKVYSIDSNSPAVLVAALYNGDILEKVAFAEGVLQAGVSTELSASLSVAQASNRTLKIFVWDSISSMKLLSDLYSLSSIGFVEEKVSSDVTTFEEFTPDFNPVYSTIEITIPSEQKGVYTIIAASKGSDLSSITPGVIDSIAYIGNGILSGGADSTISFAIDDVKFNDGYYDIYVGTLSGGFQKSKEVYYEGPDTIKNYYDGLNADDITSDDVINTITKPALKINLTDYNKITNANAKNIVIELFIANKPEIFNSVFQIQQLLDKANGIVLFATAPSVDYIAKYGALVGLKAEMFEDFSDGTLSNDAKATVAQLMSLNKPSISKLTAADVQQQFIDAYVTSFFLKDDNTYGDIRRYITDTFKAYINVDLSLITENKLDEADVYKAMLNKTYTNIASVEEEYREAIEYCIKKKDDGKKKQGIGNSPVRITVNPVAADNGQTVVKDTPLFKDVSVDYWAAESIKKLVDRGIISKGDCFRPEDYISREEFVKLIISALNLQNAEGECSFTDVSEGEWYYPYIKTAYSHNIVKGLDGNVFGIGQKISRQDIAVIIYRSVMQKTGGDGSTITEFADDGEIADYAREAVYALKNNNIINGYENNQYRPRHLATRAECAKILFEIINSANK